MVVAPTMNPPNTIATTEFNQNDCKATTVVTWHAEAPTMNEASSWLYSTNRPSTENPKKPTPRGRKERQQKTRT